jgi:outer membrane protein assembly factor BamB
VWENRIFLTTALSSTAASIFKPGRGGPIDRDTDVSEHRWLVFCIHRDTGKILWQREVYRGTPRVQRHPKNSYASATPAIDGKRVFVTVGSEGLVALDLNGRSLWKQDLGAIDAGASYDPTYHWAPASSPIVYRNLVIVQCDQQKNSFIAAFAADSGKPVWRTTRDVISSFSTPTVYEGAGRAELITNGADWMHGYDPLTGKELWRMRGSSKNTTPTPFAAEGLIYMASGYRIRPIFAIRPGAAGDISLPEGATASEQVAWSTTREGPYMSTPIVYQGYLYSCAYNGVLACLRAPTGERLYETRIGGEASTYSASPVAAAGHVYFTNEDGETFVIKASPQYELVSKNRMGEVCMATPAIAGNRIFIRTQSQLFAVGEK